MAVCRKFCCKRMPLFRWPRKNLALGNWSKQDTSLMLKVAAVIEKQRALRRFRRPGYIMMALVA